MSIGCLVQFSFVLGKESIICDNWYISNSRRLLNNTEQFGIMGVIWWWEINSWILLHIYPSVYVSSLAICFGGSLEVTGLALYNHGKKLQKRRVKYRHRKGKLVIFCCC